MSPGQEAYERLKLARPWLELADEERAEWERGAPLPPIGATLTLTQAEDVKA
jgi:hypothetical protein